MGEKDEIAVLRRLSQWVSGSFIWGVGITPPRLGQERRAALFITAALAATVLLMVVAFLLVWGRM